MAEFLDPDAPTPWVLCPECAGTWFRLTAVIERGEWSEDGEHYEDQGVPRVGAFVSVADGAAIECRDCGHKFDLPKREEIDG